jgi:cytochrome bd ubiquinol oxidase subunit I
MQAFSLAVHIPFVCFGLAFPVMVRFAEWRCRRTGDPLLAYARPAPVEAIFIAIYVYGWDRIAPRLRFLSGIPVAVAGVAGSFFVIAVNGWMNHPTGFTLRDGRAVDVHAWAALFGNPFLWREWVHITSPATSSPAS